MDIIPIVHHMPPEKMRIFLRSEENSIEISSWNEKKEKNLSKNLIRILRQNILN